MKFVVTAIDKDLSEVMRRNERIEVSQHFKNMKDALNFAKNLSLQEKFARERKKGYSKYKEIKIKKVL